MADLITLEEFKLAKGITKTDQDDLLELLISNASEIIQLYLDRPLFEEEQTITEVIDIDYDTDVIYLDNYPINSVDSLTSIDPYSYDSTVHYPVADTVYGIDLVNGKLYRTDQNLWPKGFAAVQVEYSFGGDFTVSAPLKQVTIDLVQYYKDEEYKESRSMRGASINNFNATGNEVYSSNFPPHIQRVLDLINKNGSV